MTALREQQNVLTDEQAAQIGRAMQDFRHRLNNLTGGAINQLDALEIAFHRGDTSAFAKALSDLRANARDIAHAFHRSMLYVKEPVMAPVLVTKLVEKACDDIEGGIAGVALSIAVPETLRAVTDPEVACLVIYSLLANAREAMVNNPNPTIRIQAEPRGEHIALQVMDNGPGVRDSIRNKLFQYGTTTKRQGLGFALAFARTRMKQMKGDLIFPIPQPETGAAFEILLAHPIAPEETP